MDAKRVVEYALSQIGTAEDPLGSNKQKYGAIRRLIDTPRLLPGLTWRAV